MVLYRICKKQRKFDAFLSDFRFPSFMKYDILFHMNDMYYLMNSIWIPILLAVLCVGCSIYMAITGEPGIARRRGDNRLLKDKEHYVKGAMLLMLFMALGCVIMAVLIGVFHNDTAATIESISWFIIFAFLWKRNEDRYGSL